MDDGIFDEVIEDTAAQMQAEAAENKPQVVTRADSTRQTPITGMARSVGQHLAMLKDEVIKQNAPPDFEVRFLRARMYPGGREEYLYKGAPFMEVLPPEIEIVKQEDSYTVKATVRHRKIGE